MIFGIQLKAPTWFDSICAIVFTVALGLVMWLIPQGHEGISPVSVILGIALVTGVFARACGISIRDAGWRGFLANSSVSLMAGLISFGFMAHNLV